MHHSFVILNVPIVPSVHAHGLRALAGRQVGRSLPIISLDRVASTSLQSLRFAPAIATANGIPAPSVSTLRLLPLLPLSVGLGAVACSIASAPQAHLFFPNGALVIAPSIALRFQLLCASSAAPPTLSLSSRHIVAT